MRSSQSLSTVQGGERLTGGWELLDSTVSHKLQKALFRAVAAHICPGEYPAGIVVFVTHASMSNTNIMTVPNLDSDGNLSLVC